MAAIAVAGVGLMMVCCSSSSAAMMMGGSEETPATGAGAGADADTTTPTTTTFHDSILPGAADATIVETGFEPPSTTETYVLPF